MPRGRPRKNPVIIVNQAEEEEPEERNQEEVAADEVLEEAAAENPRQPEGIVFRADPDSGELRYLTRASAITITNEWLAKKFGGGDYTVQYRKPHGNQMVIAARKKYRIDPEVQPEGRASVVYNPDGSAAGGSPDPMAAAQSAALMGFITTMTNGANAQMEQMRQNAQMTMALVKDLTNREPSPILLALVPVLPALIEKLLGKSDQTMELVRTVSELMTPKSETTMKDMLETIALIRENFAEGGEGNSTIGLVREGLSAISGMVAAKPTGLSPVVNAVSRLPAAVVVPPTGSPPLNARVFPARAWRERLHNALPQFLAYRMLVQPEKAVEYYLDNMTDAELADFEADQALGIQDGMRFPERAVSAICEGYTMTVEEVSWLRAAMEILASMEVEPNPASEEEKQG